MLSSEDVCVHWNITHCQHSLCHSRHNPDCPAPRPCTHTGTVAAASSSCSVDEAFQILVRHSAVFGVPSLPSLRLQSLWAGIYPPSVSVHAAPSFIDLLKLVNICRDSLPNLSHCGQSGTRRVYWSADRSGFVAQLKQTCSMLLLLTFCPVLNVQMF